jgi:hypothetical protein
MTEEDQLKEKIRQKILTLHRRLADSVINDSLNHGDILSQETISLAYTVKGYASLDETSTNK